MRYLVIVVALAVEVGAVVGLARLPAAEDSAAAFHAGALAALMTLALVVALNLQIVVHELGHLIAGRCVGLIFRSISVGPIQLSSVDGHLKWSLINRPLLGGMVIMTPVDKDPLVASWMWFIA